MTAKLSPTMAHALNKARFLGNGQLERWPGGFWTYPGCPWKQGTGQNARYRIPAWSVSTHTVDALLRRGLVKSIEEQRPGWSVRVEVTP